MSIKPPMCKTCGHAHFGIEHVFEGRQPTHPLASMSMFENIKTVRKEKRSEPVPHLVAPSKVKALEAEVEALTAEVAMLKRLAEKPVDTTAKPRVDTTCPVCEAKRKAKTAAQKKWRKGTK